MEQAKKTKRPKWLIPKQPPIRCPQCGGMLYLQRHRTWGLYYRCSGYPTCDVIHSAHQNDGKPMGTPAGKELRQMRRKVHATFDPLWIDAKKRGVPDARKLAYRWLGAQVGRDEQTCHVGMFDEETCRRALDAVRGRSVNVLLEWAASA